MLYELIAVHIFLRNRLTFAIYLVYKVEKGQSLAYKQRTEEPLLK